ncbi:MAG: flagellar basal body-associated FliL family protein [Planctomycetes bacterium]|nr:flagellar basal body-associated FliL family protein [Planctomycetota bacterium]
MPDPETDTAPEAAAAEETPRRPPADEGDEARASAPKGKGKRFVILCAGVAFAAGGAGYGVALLTTGGQPLAPAAAQADESADPASLTAPAPAARQVADDTDKCLYKDLEPITVNLDEPRLARYVHACLTLAIPEEEFAAASLVVDAKMLVLRDWLTVYLASLTLDEVRGPASLNRMRREILDAFNQELWPDQKPRIRKVLFKEFAVK